MSSIKEWVQRVTGKDLTRKGPKTVLKYTSKAITRANINVRIAKGLKVVEQVLKPQIERKRETVI